MGQAGAQALIVQYANKLLDTLADGSQFESIKAKVCFRGYFVVYKEMKKIFTVAFSSKDSNNFINCKLSLTHIL